MRLVRLLLLVLAWAGIATAAAGAQGFPLPLASGQPAAWLDVRQEGLYLTAPVTLDGKILFRLATAAGASSDQATIVDRITDVETVLQEITAEVRLGDQTGTAYDAGSLSVSVVPQKGQSVLQVVDAHHRDPLHVVTVTSVDAQYQQLQVGPLAAQWRTVLQAALADSLRARQPGQIQKNARSVVTVAAVLGALALLVAAVVAVLRRRMAGLREQMAAREDAAAAGGDGAGESHDQRRRLLARALRDVPPERRLRLLEGVAGLLIWGTVLVWFGALVWALALFPQTAGAAGQLRRGTFGVAAIWIVTVLIDRALAVAIARTAEAWRVRYANSAEERARRTLRVPTIANAVAGFKTFVLVFIAILTTMSAIGIPIGSVVTIGGLLAIGVSLAAQNLMRDFVNGFLVLFEDQYVVGDYVTINGSSGLVETLTLRMAQIRDAAGSLVTIPHSSVTSVVNQSRNWSRVDYRVSLDPAADAAAALELLRGTIEALAADPAWSDAFVTPVEWIGIDGLTHDWTMLRASIKTAPLRQFALKRELNARVGAAFATAHLGFGAPIAAEFRS